MRPAALHSGSMSNQSPKGTVTALPGSTGESFIPRRRGVRGRDVLALAFVPCWIMLAPLFLSTPAVLIILFSVMIVSILL